MRSDPNPDSHRRWSNFLAAFSGGYRPEYLLREAPLREIVLGVGVAGAFLLALLGWGLFARLDSAVVAPGQVVVYGNHQTVQHRDGGIISELNVHEGDSVKVGQILLQLNTDELSANIEADSTQIIELKAQQARLLAELADAHSIKFPSDFFSMKGAQRGHADAAMILQKREFETREAALTTSKEVLRQRIKESEEQIHGYEHQVAANKEQQHLISQEIDGLTTLQARGLVPATRVRSLQRNAAELSGSEGEYTANIARTRQEIDESRIRITDLQRERAADDSKDYRAAEFQLAELEPKLAALNQQFDRTIVRSPATGKVVGLNIFTVGGVVAPGQKLMDIVPDGEALVVEVRVKPTDISDLKVGQKAEIRVSAFHDRGMPKLNGVVSSISADTFTDEKNAVSFFKVTASVPASELKTISERRGIGNGLRSGLPIEMIVPLGRRNALEYLIEPLRQTLWKSFREH